MKSPNFEVLLYLNKFPFCFGGEPHCEPIILFPDMLCGGGKAKCMPERHVSRPEVVLCDTCLLYHELTLN